MVVMYIVHSKPHVLRFFGVKLNVPLLGKTFGTICPGSSDPLEEIYNIFASENEVYTSY